MGERLGLGCSLWLAFVSGVGAGCAEPSSGEGETEAATETEGEPLPEGHARVNHSFGVYELGPLEEVEPCIQWSLGNDKPIYVNEVVMTNDGGFHHSNWLVVPEDLFPGPDGFFDCSERNYTELEAAVAGTVLFAQSTQSRLDGVALPEGVVVKIPPRHKIIAGGHLLNLANSTYPTELRMSLEIVHPSLVDVVVAPFRLTYYDLDIPAMKESRFTSTCDMATAYGEPFDMKLYYVMPHYHYLGNYFDLSVSGGPNDGASIFRLEGFNASNNSKVYDPPLDLTGARGLTFTCGYDNWRDKDIGWGIGDQEMCVMLGLADSRVMMDAGVPSGSQIVGTDGDILLNGADCSVLGLPKNDAQTMPSAEEIDAPFYVPPSDPGAEDAPPVPACEDTPADAEPRLAATLTNVRDTLFASSCQYSSCHAREVAAAGLDLMAADLHSELLEHDLQTDAEVPLVEPGDPEGSYLYRVLSQCEPVDGQGNGKPHMPLNAPFLADPGLVAMVRDWIADGAKDD